jgi:hypothetical protein
LLAKKSLLVFGQDFRATGEYLLQAVTKPEASRSEGIERPIPSPAPEPAGPGEYPLLLEGF